MSISRTWKRILCLQLCLAILLPCVSALAETTKVSAYLLRLRAAPSTKGRVIDAFPRGTKVTILKKGDTWTKVKVKGKVGYMQTNRLAYSRGSSSGSSGKSSSGSSSSGSSSSGSSSSGKVKYIAPGIRLYLRAEASSYGDIVDAFRGGTKVYVLREGKFWSYVQVNGKVGYMANDYLVNSK